MKLKFVLFIGLIFTNCGKSEEVDPFLTQFYDLPSVPQDNCVVQKKELEGCTSNLPPSSCIQNLEIGCLNDSFKMNCQEVFTYKINENGFSYEIESSDLVCNLEN